MAFRSTFTYVWLFGMVGCGGREPSRDQEDPPLVGDTAETGASGDPAALPSAGQVEAELVAAPGPGSVPVGVDLRDEASERGLQAAEPAHGRGTTFVDVDGDGWMDIWQSHSLLTGLSALRTSVLWRNQGDGTFAPMDIGLSTGLLLSDWGAAWADFDNDGDPDVVIAAGGYNGEGRLSYFENDLAGSGVMVYRGADAGIHTTDLPHWSVSEMDYDRDGLLDFVVTTRARGIVAPCCIHQAVPDPTKSTAPVFLYHNLGDGRFEDVAAEMGIAPSEQDAKNATWWDYDADGWPDLFLANMATYAYRTVEEVDEEGGVRLLRNEQGQGFTDVTELVLPELELRGPVFAAAVADVDQDGFDDLYLGRHIFQELVLFGKGDGTVDVVGADYGLDVGIGWAAHENTMGLGIGDLSGDGFPDVWVGPGWPQFTGKGIVYRHQGNADGFARWNPRIEGMVEGWYHGVAMGDVDNDGDDDLFWNLGGFGPVDFSPDFWAPILAPGATTLDTREQPLLLVNHAPAPGRRAQIRLQGTVSNRDAVGAHLVVEGPSARYYQVPFTQAFTSRNSRWMNVFLGDRDEAEVVVTWPSGIRTRNTVRAGRRTTLVEPDRAR